MIYGDMKDIFELLRVCDNSENDLEISLKRYKVDNTMIYEVDILYTGVDLNKVVNNE